jgi:hypothetical protein
VGDRLDNLLYGFGRSVRRWLDGDPDQSVPVHGHQWSSFQTPLQSQAGRSNSSERSRSERELMAEHGIRAVPGGGFSARGFVFKTLDQALSWARRQERPLTTGSRLPLANVASARAPLQASRPVGLGTGPERTPSRKTAQAAGKPRWIGDPTPMQIGGVPFIAEMTYVGHGDRYAYPRNNALIDPTYWVATEGDPEGKTLSYWGSYQDLHQTARRTYLEWLAGGRSDPAAPIGYVFIYFYGLERRLLHDGSREDAPRLAAEVRRLLEIYGEDQSFRNYAERFLDVAELLAKDTAEPVVPTVALASHWEMPLRVRVYLGALLAQSQPLRADDALLWVLAMPDCYLRTPATRCFDELRELWAIRFSKEYPNGLSVRPPKARIRHVYRAAGGGFTQNVSIDELPDIGAVAAPIPRLRALLDACTQELDPLSRLLGRRPDARGTIAAAAVAPRELLEGPLGEGLRRCASALGTAVDRSAAAAVPVRDVLRLLDIEVSSATGRVGVPVLRQMASLLDGLGFGFEPDRRYGCILPVTWDSDLVLFRAGGGGKVDPDRPAYIAARTMVEIDALAALSDGEAVPVELQCIRMDLLSLPGLDAAERARLTAQAEAMLVDPPKRKETVARLVSLPEVERRRVTRSAVSAVLADGRVLPAEVRFLEGLHVALGLPQEDVYSALHRSTLVEESPGAPPTGECPPDTTMSAERAAAVQIDSSRLARIRGETTAVSALLAEIFLEEQEEQKPAQEATSSGPCRFEGLDFAHGELLWILVQRPLAWDEFEVRARAAKLLPTGAIETINEWGFEAVGEPVVEEDDPVGVPTHLLEQLSQLGGMA